MTAPSGQNGDTGFAAFISYAHRDGRHARWLHRALETYRLPRALAQAQGRNRVGRVFLDRSELATSTSLSDRIEEALTGSANLVVICSPAARASRWVNEEVRRFRAIGRGDRIFCLIVDGDPARQDEQGCFPPALLETAPGEPPPEPLAADIRPNADKPADARLKLIAGLLDVPYDALRRREAARRQRLLAIVAGVSLTLLAVMTVLTVIALISRAEAVRQRAEAVRQRNEAVRQFHAAEQTAGFLLGVFNQANPTASGGKDITVRDALDATAASTLALPAGALEPDTRASLLIVLADIYRTMGRVGDGRRVIDAALKLPVRDPEVRLRALAADAGVRWWESDFIGMRRASDEAFAIVARNPGFGKYRLTLLSQRALLASARNDLPAALRDYAEMRRLSLAASPPDRDNWLLALVGEGVAAVNAGDLDRGEPLLRRVIAERERMGEPLHPQLLTATNTLGAAAIKRGDPVAAEGWFRRAERAQRQVYGEASLEVALTRSNLGRALVEQRRFAEAVRALETARARYVAEVGDAVDPLANLEDSLGLARGGLGDMAAARAAFAHGLAIARVHAMPKEIELLADRAELYCRAGRAADGATGMADARAALARFALPEPWRAARLDSVEAGCLLAAGKPADAKPLIARSHAVVIARWGPTSLFGATMRAQMRAVGL